MIQVLKNVDILGERKSLRKRIDLGGLIQGVVAIQEFEDWNLWMARLPSKIAHAPCALA